MIPLREQEVIRARFRDELKSPVKIDFFTQRPTSVFVPGREDCRFCPETGQMLEELAHLSDLVELRTHELGSDHTLEQRHAITRVPATVVRGVVNRPIIFYGIPAAEMFPVLIESIVDASGPTPDLAPTAKRKLKRLKRAVVVQVFVAPGAPYCAEQARMAQIVALSSQHVRAEVIEITEFPQLAQQLGIRAVPATVIDGKIFLTGLTEPEEFLDQLVKATEYHAVAARSPLLAGSKDRATPLPSPPDERATPPGAVTRPSGLIIPGR